MTARALATAALALLLASSARAQIFLNEGFTDVAGLPAAGWVIVNASDPVRSSWFPGNPAPFTAQAGADGAYVAANFVTAGSAGFVDQWLITPELPLQAGYRVKFYTRTHGPGYADLLRVRLGVGSSSALGNFSTVLLTIGPGGAAYPSSGWDVFTVFLPALPGLTSGRIAFEYAVTSTAEANYVGIDSLLIDGGPDADGDGIADVSDDCPSIPDTDQADADADGVGDVCDNCVTRRNPRVAANFLSTNQWATLTGGQRDDDHDGYGNACDAKFPGVSGLLVGSGDLVQFRASAGKNRTGDTCGTTMTRPCAIFNLSENGLLVGPPDLAQLRLLSGKAPGPKCAACPLVCTAGTAGTCGTIP